MKVKHMIWLWAGIGAGSHPEPGRWEISSRGNGNIRAWAKARLDRWIPEGHEDEAGFHFGPPPAVKLYDAVPVDPATAGREG